MTEEIFQPRKEHTSETEKVPPRVLGEPIGGIDSMLDMGTTPKARKGENEGKGVKESNDWCRIVSKTLRCQSSQMNYHIRQKRAFPIL